MSSSDLRAGRGRMRSTEGPRRPGGDPTYNVDRRPTLAPHRVAARSTRRTKAALPYPGGLEVGERGGVGFLSLSRLQRGAVASRLLQGAFKSLRRMRAAHPRTRSVPSPLVVTARGIIERTGARRASARKTTHLSVRS